MRWLKKMLDQLFWHHKQHHTKVLTQCQLTALKHTYQLSNCITYSVVVIWMISLKVFKHKTHPQKPLNRTKKFRSCTEKEMVPMERCIIWAVVTTLHFPFKLLKFWQRIKPDSQNVPGSLISSPDDAMFSSCINFFKKKIAHRNFHRNN